jgi:DNA (cytosine-5)-methyltransferase 1
LLARETPTTRVTNLRRNTSNWSTLFAQKNLLLENVEGLQGSFKETKTPPYSDVVKKTLRELDWGGYQVFSSMVNASSFRVPQLRARFIMITVRSDLATKGVPNSFNEFVSYCQSFRDKNKLNSDEISVKEEISDLEIGKRKLVASVDTNGFRHFNYRQYASMSPFQALMRQDVSANHKTNSMRVAKHRDATITKFVEILRTPPKGKSLSKENRERFNSKKQYLMPLHPNQMSKTITTLPDDLLHYSEPRILAVRESA